MPLTVKKIHSIKPSEKTIKVFDARGLYLQVPQSGGKWWRLKYRFAGKEKKLSLGVYPEVSLKKHARTGMNAAGIWPMASIQAKIARR
jgi:Arm DNA-binding domain